VEVFLSLHRNCSCHTSCHGEEEGDSIALPGAGVAISHHVIARDIETWQSRTDDYLLENELKGKGKKLE